jgi:predicted transcriptional regulator
VFDVSNKELVLETVRNMPEDAALAEISEEIAILAALREAETALAEGRTVSHEEVKARLASWLTA